MASRSPYVPTHRLHRTFTLRGVDEPLSPPDLPLAARLPAMLIDHKNILSRFAKHLTWATDVDIATAWAYEQRRSPLPPATRLAQSESGQLSVSGETSPIP